MQDDGAAVDERNGDRVGECGFAVTRAMSWWELPAFTESDHSLGRSSGPETAIDDGITPGRVRTEMNLQAHASAASGIAFRFVRHVHLWADLSGSLLKRENETGTEITIETARVPRGR